MPFLGLKWSDFALFGLIFGVKWSNFAIFGAKMVKFSHFGPISGRFGGETPRFFPVFGVISSLKRGVLFFGGWGCCSRVVFCCSVRPRRDVGTQPEFPPPPNGTARNAERSAAVPQWVRIGRGGLKNYSATQRPEGVLQRPVGNNGEPIGTP